MEIAILGVSRRYQIRNGEIRRRTRVTDIAQRAEVAMDGAHSSEQGWRWGSKVMEWQPCTGKGSVGRPPTSFTDDIKRVAGSRWNQAAQTIEFGTPYKRPAVDVYRLI
ncbi:jg9860 [Pararge aegeria aegeria]|uniref:Jg9860 protein n=1 Tax=Pararge aegeria aegeria TaxID=348720 RepID=A0A8S4RHL3_9NEOP|nr:jg9860 [Pararge aegeria aegeria]